MHTDSLLLELIFFAGFSELCKVDLLKRTNREANVVSTNWRRTVKDPSPYCVVTRMRSLVEVSG